MRSMADCPTHQDGKVVNAWRALAGRLIIFVLALALVAPFSTMSDAANSGEDADRTSISMGTGQQHEAGPSEHALASHMCVEHHQLIQSDNAFLMPTRDIKQVYFLAIVDLPASLKLPPPHRPPCA